MEVSIEYYLLVNLGMNFLTLAAIARCRGQVRWIALICAAAAGAVYAVLMQLAAFSALKHPALRIALTLLMAVIALRPVGMRDALSAMAMLLGGSALLGGAQLVAMEVVHSAGPRRWRWAARWERCCCFLCSGRRSTAWKSGKCKWWPLSAANRRGLRR